VLIVHSGSQLEVGASFRFDRIVTGRLQAPPTARRGCRVVAGVVAAVVFAGLAGG